MARVEMHLLPGGRARYIRVDGVPIPGIKKVTVIGSADQFTAVQFEIEASQVEMVVESNSVTKTETAAIEVCQCPIENFNDLPQGSECLVCGKPVAHGE